MKKPLTVSDLVAGAGAVVTFIFSFLNFVKYGDDGRNAWSGDAFAFVSTVPAILGLVLAVWIVLDLTGVKLPAQVLTYNATQLKGTWGISAAGLMVAWLASDLGGIDKGAGFWLMLLGSLAMAVGTVMGLLGKGTETVNVGTSPSSTTTPPSETPPPPPPPAPDDTLPPPS